MIAMVFGLVAVAVIVVITHHNGFPGSARNVGRRMSGVWANAGRRMHVLLYSAGPILRGHVVWSGEESFVGSLVIKELRIKPYWKWSSETYIDPGTNSEFPLSLRLKNNNVLSVRYMETAGGRTSTIHEEEWKLIDAM